MANQTTSHDSTIRELYQDESAHIVASCGLAYYLTPCCDAAAKGSMGSIVCRSCYEDVDHLFGMGGQDWERFPSTCSPTTQSRTRRWTPCAPRRCDGVSPAGIEVAACRTKRRSASGGFAAS